MFRVQPDFQISARLESAILRKLLAAGLESRVDNDPLFESRTTRKRCALHPQIACNAKRSRTLRERHPETYWEPERTLETRTTQKTLCGSFLKRAQRKKRCAAHFQLEAIGTSVEDFLRSSNRVLVPAHPAPGHSTTKRTSSRVTNHGPFRKGGGNLFLLPDKSLRNFAFPSLRGSRKEWSPDDSDQDSRAEGDGASGFGRLLGRG